MNEEEMEAISIIERAIAQRILPPLGEEPISIDLGSVAYNLLDGIKRILGAHT